MANLILLFQYISEGIYTEQDLEEANKELEYRLSKQMITTDLYVQLKTYLKEVCNEG